jgi:hypothetical protein
LTGVAVPPPPRGLSGAGGFDERGQYDDPPLALGHIAGFRLFDFGGPRSGRWPIRPAGALEGHHGGYTWADGDNVATCPSGERPPHPADTCGCGFWAYWSRHDAFSVWQPGRPVLAAIEGYGRTAIGSKGFRCEKARIAALCLLFDVAAYAWQGGAAWGDQVIEQAAYAEFEDVLGQRYPGAVICSTENLLLTRYPSSPEYANAAPEPDRNSFGRAAWNAAVGMERFTTAVSAVTRVMAGPLTVDAARKALERRAEAPKPAPKCGLCGEPSPNGLWCGTCPLPQPPPPRQWTSATGDVVLRDDGQPGSTRGFYTRPNGHSRDWAGKIINIP